VRAVNKFQLSEAQLDKIIDSALAEDISQGDITSETLIPAEFRGKASLRAKAKGILAGIDIAGRVFQRVDPSIQIEFLTTDGTEIKAGDVIATFAGKVASILKAERTALNFLRRLSGTATLTAGYVAEVKGLPTVILDTRKTTPGLRILEKYAVRLGGGQNHRLHLGDMILIKDNHLSALRATGMSLKDIVAQAKKKAPPGIKVEVEVSTVPEALEAVAGGVDIIMLDNMSPAEIRQVISQIPDHIKTEASGGITRDNISAVAQTGVDYISIGALTHSAPALDISLELEPATKS
jgi:nicotinate-nucleotide pyrophosphorylase (carboxylating)